MTGRNLYLLLAREVTSDSSDNMNSIIKIIEKFSATAIKSELEKSDLEIGKSVIGIPVSFAITSSWLLDKKTTANEKFTIEVDILDPSGKSLGKQSQEHEAARGISKLNFNFLVQGLPVTASGEYTLKAELKNSKNTIISVAQYPYEVDIQWEKEKL